MISFEIEISIAEKDDSRQSDRHTTGLSGDQ